MAQQLYKGDKRISLASTNSTEKDHTLKIINEENLVKMQKVCRICLGEEEKNQIFIKPCKCSGSLQYTHESCLLQWVNRMIQRRIELNQPIDNLHCQICQQTLELKKGRKLKCRDYSEIIKRTRDYRKIVVIILIFIIINFGVIGFLFYIQFGNPQMLEGESSNAVLKVAWVVIGCHLVFWIFKFVWTFVVYLQTYVKKVVPMKRQIMRRLMTQSDIRLMNPEVQQTSSLNMEGINGSDARKVNLMPINLKRNQVLNPEM